VALDHRRDLRDVVAYPAAVGDGEFGDRVVLHAHIVEQSRYYVEGRGPNGWCSDADTAAKPCSSISISYIPSAISSDCRPPATSTSSRVSAAASRSATLAPSPRPGDIVWMASPRSVTLVVGHWSTLWAERITTGNVASTSAS